MKNKTILILGVSSFVGSNLAEFLKMDFKVFGTYYKNRVEIPDVLSFHCDILKSEQVESCIRITRPDFTIYCPGISSISECQDDPTEAQRINANGLYFVTEHCHKYNSTLIYISSSMVFSGEKESYGEIDIPDFTTNLGKTKSSGEYFLETSFVDYLIFRCCQFYGRGMTNNKPNFFWQLERGKEFFCDDTLLMGFLDVNYLGMIISLAIENNLRNLLLHVCSTNILSRYQFANQYAKNFNIDPGFIKKTQIKLPYIEGKTSSPDKKLTFHLDTKNIENYLNILPPTIEESLNFTFKRFNGQSS